MTNRTNPQHGVNMVDRYIGSAFDIVYAVYKELDSFPLFIEFVSETSPRMEAQYADIIERFDHIVSLEASALNSKEVAEQAAADALEYRDTTQALIDEAEEFKQFVTNVVENTIQDIEERFAEFIVASGYEFIGNYGIGIEVTEYNQLLRDVNGEFWRLSGQRSIPYVTTGAGLPEDDAFIPVGDASLRQDLDDPAHGSKLIKYDDNNTVYDAIKRNREDFWANKETLGGVYTHYVREDDGDPISGAECAVYVGGTGVLATNLRDKHGAPLANPFTTGEDGLVQFIADPGKYTLQVSFDLIVHAYSVYFADEQVRAELADPDKGAELVAYGNKSVSDALDQVAVIDYAAGITLVGYNQLVRDENGEFWRVSGTTPLPYTTTGAGVDEGGALVSAGDAVLRQHLADPDKGARLVHGAVIYVDTIPDLQALAGSELVDGQQVQVKEYHAGTGVGGGEFYWDAARSSVDHNGGLVIDPNAPWPTNWASPTEADAWYDHQGTGSGAWVRQSDGVLRLSDFGVWLGVWSADSSAAWIRANRYAAVHHKELVLPDGVVNVHRPAVLRASVLDWRSIRLRGTFNTSATGLYVSTDSVGSVIRTNNNSALLVYADTNTSENMVVDGVGFINGFVPEPYYEAGPIVLTVGGASLPVRYTTGHYFRGAAVGYRASLQFAGSTPSTIENAISFNFVGPVTLDRWNATMCQSALLLSSASVNHCWVRNSTWFYLSGSAIELNKLEGVPKGNFHISLDNVVMEHLRGFVNATSSATLAEGGFRNALFLNNVNREYCGLYGIQADGWQFTGSPLGYVADTDVHISGNWTPGLAFGETALPVRDPGSVFYATREVRTQAETGTFADGVTNTPHMVDRAELKFTLAAGQSKNIFVYGNVGYYSSKIAVAVNSLTSGSVVEFNVLAPTTTGGSTGIETTGRGIPEVSVTAVGRSAPAEMAVVSLHNSTGGAVNVSMSAIDPTGRSIPQLIG